MVSRVAVVVEYRARADTIAAVVNARIINAKKVSCCNQLYPELSSSKAAAFRKISGFSTRFTLII